MWSLLVLDATEGVLGLDATIAGYAHEGGRAVHPGVNKWDLIDEPARSASSKHDLRDKLKFLDYAPVIFLSAKTGDGVKTLVPADPQSLRVGIEARHHRGAEPLRRKPSHLKSARFSISPKLGIRPPHVHPVHRPEHAPALLARALHLESNSQALRI